MRLSAALRSVIHDLTSFAKKPREYVLYSNGKKSAKVRAVPRGGLELGAVHVCRSLICLQLPLKHPQYILSRNETFSKILS